nr:MAG TPA: hypothetical protein [Caudoviricetes sp.]
MIEIKEAYKPLFLLAECLEFFSISSIFDFKILYLFTNLFKFESDFFHFFYWG